MRKHKFLLEIGIEAESLENAYLKLESLFMSLPSDINFECSDTLTSLKLIVADIQKLEINSLKSGSTIAYTGSDDG